MGDLMRRGGWLTSLLIFSMPVFLIMFLGSIMAYAQVQGEFHEYQEIQEYTNLAELASVSQGELVILRGRIADGTSPSRAQGLIVFQERPLDGREVRFREEFPLIFPEFRLELADGTLLIQPSSEREQMIAHELHRIADESRDREYTGFGVGDVVAVQGEWWPTTSGQEAVLREVTGITSTDRAGIMTEWQNAFGRLAMIRTVLGILSALSIILLIIQVRRVKTQPIIPHQSELTYG